MRAILAIVLGLALLACGTGNRQAGSTELVEPDAPAAPAGMRRIQVDDLPQEAIVVLDRIEQGGPYRYDADGSVFENREGLLPDRPSGYYREYTVETPGEDDRGARRIVAGAEGERFWTDDHYASFEWIAE
jgi:ribonuclease T1